jgi:syringate O-demethylase
MHPFDRVMVGDKPVGVSTWIGYSSNERCMLTLAILDTKYAEPGTQVTFIWGEEGGGSRKPTVEPHTQAAIKATVSPVPYSEVARTSYADVDGWRSKS